MDNRVIRPPMITPYYLRLCYNSSEELLTRVDLAFYSFAFVDRLNWEALGCCLLWLEHTIVC